MELQRNYKRNLVAICGLLTTLVLLAVYMAASGSSSHEMSPKDSIQDAMSTFADESNLSPLDKDSVQRTIGRSWLSSALYSYFRKNGKYPETLDQVMTPEYHVSAIPIDAAGNPYRYELLDGSLGYRLCGVEEDGKDVCL